MIVSVFIPTVLADPSIVRVTLDPVKPLPLSTITFTAILTSNGTIDEVRLLIQECRGDLCFVNGYNISMVLISNDTYQGQCTLLQEEATQIKYYLRIGYNETWYTSNITFMPLTTDTKKNASQDSHDQVSTPDFEMPLLILSIAMVLISNHWWRKSGGKR